jgi:thymidylate kinase
MRSLGEADRPNGAMPTDLFAPAGEAPESEGIPSLVRELAMALDDRGIRYCHWKSTEALGRVGTSGDTDQDLDLLAHPGDASRFRACLVDLAFKSAVAPPTRAYPGVEHWFGLDSRSGRLIHVHAHYRLILGHDATKNYHLPIEEAYVGSSSSGPVLRLPTPEFEYVLLILRMVLKHATWDAMAGLQGSLSASERRELVDLTGRIDPDTVEGLLRRHLPFIDRRHFNRCVVALRPGASWRFRARTARDLHRLLSAYARTSEVLDTPMRIWRRLSWQLRRAVSPQSTRKRLANGGAIVALVGGDGAGKSSMAAELHRLFSPHVRSTLGHLGKPPPSSASFVLRALLVAGRRIGLVEPRHVPGITAEEAEAPPSRTQALRYALLARDRFRAYVRARRVASNGGVAVCDRYPVGEIVLMDGPRLMSPRRPNRRPRVIGWLADVERRYYERILPPDVLIVLLVDPEVAVARKPDENAGFVRRRSEHVWRIDWRGTTASVLDAGRPMPEVVSDLKSLVWSRL